VSDEGTFTRCPWCGEVVDPYAESVHYAVPVQRYEAMGKTHYADGLGGLFHEDCSLPHGLAGKAEAVEAAYASRGGSPVQRSTTISASSPSLRGGSTW
jgi:hypothetical protein